MEMIIFSGGAAPPRAGGCAPGPLHAPKSTAVRPFDAENFKKTDLVCENCAFQLNMCVFYSFCCMFDQFGARPGAPFFNDGKSATDMVMDGDAGDEGEQRKL